MSEYIRLVSKAKRIQTVVEGAALRVVFGADARAKVMLLMGAELIEGSNPRKVRGDLFLPIAASADGSEVGVHLEGNKIPAIVSHVVYPPVNPGGGPCLYAKAEEAVTHYMIGSAIYPEEGLEEGLMEEAA